MLKKTYRGKRLEIVRAGAGAEVADEFSDFVRALRAIGVAVFVERRTEDREHFARVVGELLDERLRQRLLAGRLGGVRIGRGFERRGAKAVGVGGDLRIRELAADNGIA